MLRKLATTALFIGFSAALCSFSPSVALAEEAEQSDLKRGEKLFQFCTKCHGLAGEGNSAALAPAIAGMPAWYVEKQLQNFKNGVRGLHPDDTGGLRMYPMSQWLRDAADQKSVAAYVASLAPMATANELTEAGDAAKGAGLYAICSGCHAADGAGNEGMGAPPLTGQSDWYLYSAIKKYKSGVRGSGPGDALGAAMIGMVGTLSDDQAVRDVIAHIQTLGQ